MIAGGSAGDGCPLYNENHFFDCGRIQNLDWSLSFPKGLPALQTKKDLLITEAGKAFQFANSGWNSLLETIDRFRFIKQPIRSLSHVPQRQP